MVMDKVCTSLGSLSKMYNDQIGEGTTKRF